MRISRLPSNVEIGLDAPLVQGHDCMDVLTALERGFNTESHVVWWDDPSAQQKTCFYVIVSKEGISTLHAVMKMLSKGASLAVYAFGTAIFAAAQLMSISVALMILSVVLGCAAFARANGMYIAAEMNRYTEPILHTVVKTEADLAAHVQGVLGVQGLIVEIKDHVIVTDSSGARCVARTNWLLSLHTYFGLLAPPFNLQRIGIRPVSPFSRRNTDMSTMSAEQQSYLMRSLSSQLGTPSMTPMTTPLAFQGDQRSGYDRSRSVEG